MRHVRWWPIAALLLAVGPPARADEEFDQLKAALDAAQQKWYSAMNEARGETGDAAPDPDKLPPRPEAEFIPRFKAYAEKHAGKPAAIPALVWLVQARQERGTPGTEKSQRTALATLLQAHAAQPELGSEMEELQFVSYKLGAKRMLEFYERVARDNPDKTAKAWAEFSIASILYGRGDEGGGDSDASEGGGRKRAGELFRKVAREYAGTKAAKQADGYVYELDNLQIGMKAPDFVGKDADEREIRLSQYRGKVVVVDFWGFW